jgi:hypothetical protein
MPLESNANLPPQKSKFRTFLVACILALESIYKINPPEREKICIIDCKDNNNKKR